jgi:ArsR family transcriptional regulator
MEEQIKIIKALSDPSRLRIFTLLYIKPLCVCEIESIIKINQSNASRHLQRLKDAGLVRYEKQGQFVIHTVDKETLQNHRFLEHLIAETKTIPQIKEDISLLEKIPDMKCNSDK